MAIQAICFDADGVVVNPQMQFSKLLREAHGISPEMTRGFFQGIFNDCLVGRADLGEVLPGYLSEWGWKGSADEFIQTWLRADHVVDERLIQVIRNLRQSGILCCLATSQERNRAEYMKSEMGFQEEFNYLFFSCEIGWQKPQREYFLYLEKTLKLEKEAILFWDDARVNVEAAREQGWHAEQYTDYEAFANTLSKYVMIGSYQ